MPDQISLDRATVQTIVNTLSTHPEVDDLGSDAWVQHKALQIMLDPASAGLAP